MDLPKTESVRIACPHCAVTLKAKLVRVGTLARCPKCGKEFRIKIPEVPEATLPPVFPAASNPTETEPLFIRTASAPRKPPPAPIARISKNQAVLYASLGVAGGIAILFALGTFSQRDNSAIDRLGDFIDSMIGLPFLLATLVFYMLPTGIAWFREHENLIPIAIVNFFFGWTGIGWIVALAWAFSSGVREIRQTIRKVVVHQNGDDDEIRNDKR